MPELHAQCLQLIEIQQICPKQYLSESFAVQTNYAF